MLSQEQFWWNFACRQEWNCSSKAAMWSKLWDILSFRETLQNEIISLHYWFYVIVTFMLSQSVLTLPVPTNKRPPRPRSTRMRQSAQSGNTDTGTGKAWTGPGQSPFHLNPRVFYFLAFPLAKAAAERNCDRLSPNLRIYMKSALYGSKISG